MPRGDLNTANENDLIQMDLHETIEYEDGFMILRVVGGWIYTWTDDRSAVFVPVHPT